VEEPRLAGGSGLVGGLILAEGSLVGRAVHGGAMVRCVDGEVSDGKEVGRIAKHHMY